MNSYFQSFASWNLAKPMLGLAAVSFFAAQCLSHFVFVVPAKEAGKLQVVFSDDLEPDDQVKIDKIVSLKLTARVDGKDVAVESTKTGEHALGANLPKGTTVVYGSIVYGASSRGDAPASLLVYHPKLALATGKECLVGEKTPIEVVPYQKGNETKFQLLYQGKPVADAEGSIALPDGKKEKLKTDKEGFTAGFAGTGNYGLWLRHVVANPGEHGGKKYKDEKHYATLVGALASTTAKGQLAPLPAAVSSLGATVADGYLYVYGGHVGKTHTYSTKDVLGDFRRLDLAGGKPWETLPSGPIAQGMNLITYKGKIIRVGGMQPRNTPSEPTDNISLASCASYDPKTNQWTDLPAMPSGRSSHDIVVVGDKLVVVGGWEQKGKGNKEAWHDTALVLDLAQSQPKWESIPQPFKRRALTAGAVGQKVYVMCGLDANASAHRNVDVLDLETLKWSSAPEVPGSSNRMGFSPAAATLNGRLLVNTSEGPLYRLSQDGKTWDKVGAVAKPRMVHRLVPHGNGVVVVGGASRGGNVAEVEIVIPAPADGVPVSLGATKK